MAETVWIIVREGGNYAGVVSVHASRDDAYEDLDIRTERGARPDLAHRYHVEEWAVRQPDPVQPEEAEK